MSICHLYSKSGDLILVGDRVTLADGKSYVVEGWFGPRKGEPLGKVILREGALSTIHREVYPTALDARSTPTAE